MNHRDYCGHKSYKCVLIKCEFILLCMCLTNVCARNETKRNETEFETGRNGTKQLESRIKKSSNVIK